MVYKYSIQFIIFGFTMTDIDKRNTRRKKFMYSKDKDETVYNFKKFSSEKDGEIRYVKLCLPENEESVSRPATIMLRQKEDGDMHNLTPKIPPPVEKPKEEEIPDANVKIPSSIVQKTNAVSNCDVSLTIPQLEKSMCLIEDGQFVSDGILDYLTEQNEFLVIGCLGLQGVGKSMLMSQLIGKSANEKEVFNVQTFDNIVTCTHCTSNVDLYITEDRVFFLDTPPLLSPSFMDSEAKKLNVVNSSFISSSTGTHVATDLSTGEAAMEIYSLQLASFILSVCHVVILVQDWFYDPNILRFIQSAEMLKPHMTTSSKEDNLLEEYFPHLVLLQNKAQFSDYTPASVSMMQDVYNQVLLRSRLRIQSNIGIASGFVIEDLNQITCGDLINLYILPDINNKDDKEFPLKNHPGYLYLVNKLKRDLYGITKYPLTHTTLTEKNWFHYSNTVWETIKNSNFFLEYNKLLYP